MDLLEMITQTGPLFLTRNILTEMQSRALTPEDGKTIKKEMEDLVGVRTLLTEVNGNLPIVSPEMQLIFKDITDLLNQYKELQGRVPR